uniref:CCHC-type domain-containing protein n=1 Tax=Xenopus tropicalis TaxID=8364 RepID=A0A803JA32_XENTR
MSCDLFDDGISHPQSNFRLGAERGFMFYSGMPKYCQRCNKFGHIPQDCESERVVNFVRLKPDADRIGGFLKYAGQPKYCRLCFCFGHVIEDCNKGKCCRNCGKAGH